MATNTKMSQIPNLVQVGQPTSPGFAGIVVYGPNITAPSGWGLCSTTATTTFSGSIYPQLYARVPAGWQSGGNTVVPILNSPDTDLVPFIKLYDDAGAITIAGSPFVGSNFSEDFITKTDDFTAEVDKSYIINKSTAVAVTLPAMTLGKVITFKNIGAGLVTITRAGADTIDGASSITLSQYQAIKIKGFNTNLWGVY